MPRPHVDVLTMGFSCKDISPLTSTPKSDRGDGSSGISLRAGLDYLHVLALDERPKLVIMENVLCLTSSPMCLCSASG